MNHLQQLELSLGKRTELIWTPIIIIIIIIIMIIIIIIIIIITIITIIIIIYYYLHVDLTTLFNFSGFDITSRA